MNENTAYCFQCFHRTDSARCFSCNKQPPRLRDSVHQALLLALAARPAQAEGSAGHTGCMPTKLALPSRHCPKRDDSQQQKLALRSCWIANMSWGQRALLSQDHQIPWRQGSCFPPRTWRKRRIEIGVSDPTSYPNAECILQLKSAGRRLPSVPDGVPEVPPRARIPAHRSGGIV